MQQITVPEWMMKVKYNGRIIPKEANQNIIVTGANCQVFAYQLLRQHDLIVPNYRSSELWADEEYSRTILDDFQPLDILFFHKKEAAYGAHLAVYVGENRAIHLAKNLGYPVIWTLETFLEQPKYSFLLGGKRFR